MPTATVAPKTLEVPALRIGRVLIRLEGDSPLVCHRFDEKAMNIIKDKVTGKAQKGRETRVPAADFARAFYVMPGTTPTVHDEGDDGVWAEGHFGFPAVGLKAAAVRAATDVGLKMTDMRRAFHIQGDLVEISPTEGTPPKMRMDMVRVGVGSADVRFRPEFTDWHIDAPVDFNEAVITVPQIVNLFNLAGFGVGIGEWRPERNGQWGRFHVGAEVKLLS